MAKKSKLLKALDNEKGVDYQKQHQKKLQKQAGKRKRSKDVSQEEVIAEADGVNEDGEQDIVLGDAPAVSNGLGADGEEEEEGWETDEGEKVFDTSRLIESESESDEDDEMYDNQADAAEGEEEEEDIPLSDIESLASADKEDIIPHQKMTINNTTALLKAHKSFALPVSKLPFSAHQSITSEELTAITDINDDLNRELAFYSQSLSAVKSAQALLRAEGIPFSRPVDYFAEMVKSDEHMGRVKQKLVDTAAGKKAAGEARRQRDLKKFGKQVQVAKEQERAKSKRDTLEKINNLKRKRQGAALTQENEGDIFDVALEDAATTAKNDRDARRAAAGGKPNFKRQKRDDKYGFGGKKRFAKSNDAASSADTRGFSAKKMKGQKRSAPRPGKSKRAKGRL